MRYSVKDIGVSKPCFNIVDDQDRRVIASAWGKKSVALEIAYALDVLDQMRAYDLLPRVLKKLDELRNAAD